MTTRGEQTWGRRAILIADGDRRFRRSAARALAAAGLHVREAAYRRVAGLLVGADDYLAKPIALEELVARVRRHLQRTATLEAKSSAGLTAREAEVLTLLTHGLGPVEIAGELSISPKTVATHVEHIYSKPGVHTRAQAVARALQPELVPGPSFSY